MVDYNKAARDIVWIYGLYFFVMPMGFLIRIIYARNLSVVDYGIFYGLFAFFGLFDYFRNFGLNSAAFYFANKYIVKGDKSKFKTVFLINQGVQLFFSIVIALLLYVFKGTIINRFYSGEGHIEFMFSIFLIWWIFQTIRMSNINFFRIFHDNKTARALESLEIILILVFSLFGFFIVENYKVPVLAYVLSMFLITLFSSLLFFVKHNDYFVAPLYKGMDLINSVFKYAIWILPATFAVLLLSQMDMLMIQYFIGAEAVAYYVSGFSIANLLMLFTVPMAYVIYPIVARLWHKEEKTELSNLLSFIMNNILIFLLPFSFFFFAFAQQIIDVAFTSKFFPSIIILLIFSISFIFKVVGSMLTKFLSYSGRPKLCSILFFVVALTNFLLNLILIPIYGGFGAAIATSFCFFLMFLLFFISVRRYILINLDIVQNLKILSASLIFILICFLLRNNINIFHFDSAKLSFIFNGFVIFAIALFFYFASLIIFGVLNKDKYLLIKSLIIER